MISKVGEARDSDSPLRGRLPLNMVGAAYLFWGYEPIAPCASFPPRLPDADATVDTFSYKVLVLMLGSIMATSTKGRPKIIEEQLEFFTSLHISWEEIATILGISSKILKRRAREWNIPNFSTLTDAELDRIVREYMQQFPNCGEVMLRGHLQSTGLSVQRRRVRECIHRIAGSHNSQHPAIFRRSYSLPGPNHLWHVDGNHKMIRWQLVIHGGIDGFSRLITYLKCSNNNRVDTVSACFLLTTQEYGVPSRVRSHHGGENVGIWRSMEEVRGPNRGSYIAGRSVHNTRIERLWRDVYTAVTSTFVFIFQYLEEQNALVSDNDTLTCFVYTMSIFLS